MIYFCWGAFYKVLNTYNLSATIVDNTSLMRIANFITIALILILIIINIDMKSFKLNYFILFEEIFLVFLSYFLSGHSTGTAFIVSIVLIIASKDINFDSILKTFLMFSIIIFSVGIILNFVGILPSMVRLEGYRLRNSMGFSYVSYPSQILFYIVCAWLAWRKERVTYVELLILECSTYLVYLNTKTISPFILSTLLLAYICVLRIFKIKQFITRFKITRLLASFTFPIAFLFLLWLLFKAPTSIFTKVNQLVNNRLTLSLNGMNQFGTSMFGKHVVFSGYDVFGSSLNYNFVDSSYIQNLILNGWLYTLIIIVLFTLITYKLVQNNQEYIIAVLVIVSVHSMFDPQLMLLWYSPFPFLLGKAFKEKFLSMDSNEFLY